MINKIGLRSFVSILIHFTKTSFTGLFALVIIVVFGVVQFAFAEQLLYAKTGIYVGLSLPYNNIEGDFNGDTALVGASDIILVPSIENGFGFGISLGVTSGQFAGEINYLRTTHDGNFQGAKGDVEYNLVNLDGKYYFLAHKRVQPYLLMGLSFPWLTIVDGSATLSPTPSVGDATLNGIGLNLGTGIAYYLHPRISINAGIIYRPLLYTRAEGVVGEGELEDTIDGSGFNFSVGIAYIFYAF
jgi:hypothetical protein